LLAIATPTMMKLAKLTFSASADFEFNINYDIISKKDHDKIKNISISNLGDIIAIIDKLNIIKVLNQNLEILYTINNPLLNNGSPFDVFSVTNGMYYY